MIKTALVTGAGSGIGRATAIRLADSGFHVVVADIDDSGAGVTVESVASNGGTAEPLHLDVSDLVATETALQGLISKVGVPHVVVNNAGIGVRGTLPETSPEQWQHMIDVNLTGMFAVLRTLLPGMIERGDGVIVNISSAGGLVGLTERAGYCATKAGVIGLTRALAADHAKSGIRANAICPGTVETAWIDRILTGAPDRDMTLSAMKSRQLDGRLGQPSEVAAGVAFLASEEGRFMNGSVLVMDGGLTAV